MIYYVEDDQAIAYIIDKTIKNAGFTARGFASGKDFLESYFNEKPKMILLDIMLPDMSGIDLLKTIRAHDQTTPIMMLSALSDEMDKVKAIDLGADDYMTKPFGVLELTSRIQAKLRKIAAVSTFKYKDIEIDDKKHTIMIEGEVVNFTVKEFGILKFLIEKHDQTVSKETIFFNIWETDFMGETRTLDMHIKSIREKLKKAHSQVVIATIRGVGYQIK